LLALGSAHVDPDGMSEFYYPDCCLAILTPRKGGQLLGRIAELSPPLSFGGRFPQGGLPNVPIRRDGHSDYRYCFGQAENRRTCDQEANDDDDGSLHVQFFRKAPNGLRLSGARKGVRYSRGLDGTSMFR
jgi:hypothetical protein